MTYEELCKMAIAICDELFNSVIDEMETEETRMTISAELNGTHKIKITIEKIEMDGDSND